MICLMCACRSWLGAGLDVDVFVAFFRDCYSSAVQGNGIDRTLYFSRSSLERGALMMVRRTLEGAEKCAFLDFLLEEDRAIHPHQSSHSSCISAEHFVSIQELILVILAVLGEIVVNKVRRCRRRPRSRRRSRIKSKFVVEGAAGED